MYYCVEGLGVAVPVLGTGFFNGVNLPSVRDKQFGLSVGKVWVFRISVFAVRHGGFWFTLVVVGDSCGNCCGDFLKPMRTPEES